MKNWREKWWGRKLDELFGLDLRSLAVARVSLAFIVLVDLLIRASALTAHYGSGSVFPPSVLENDWVQTGFWSYSFLFGAPEWTGFLMAVQAVFAFMLLIGWKTRLASVITWTLLLSLQHANPLVLQGGDILLRLILFIGIFLPWGKYFSVDQALTYKNAPTRHLSFWTVAYLLQLTWMYLFAPFLKTSSIWREGQGVYYALSIDQLSTPLGEFMLGYLPILTFLTFAVLLVQHAAPALIFFPFKTVWFRSTAIILLAAMHLSFAFHMHLGPFSWISLAALAGFLPSQFWDTLIGFARKRNFGGVAMYYDGDCGFCKKSVYLIRSFLLLPATTIAPAQTDASIYADLREKDSWVVVDHAGGRHFAYDAAIALVRSSPVFFFLAPLMRPALFQRIGNRVYRYVAAHRKRMCAPEIPHPPRGRLTRITLGTLSSTLALFFIIYTFMWNATDVAPFNHQVRLPPNMTSIGRALGFDQYWAMFAPFPLIDDGWYVAQATYQNGHTSDLMRGGAKVDLAKPKNVSAMYPNERWRKYLMNLWHADYSRYRKYYLDYLCRTANESRSTEDAIVRVDLYFMLEKTPPPGQPVPAAEQILLEGRECARPLL